MVPSIYGENMFDEFFDNNGFFGSHSPLFGKNSKNLMKTDIRETDDAKAYRFAVELPGFKKEDIHVHIDGPVVSISAERKQSKEVKEGERVLRTERYFGQVSRSFQLGQDVDESRSSAKFADGVLELTLPKKLAPQAKRLVID